jgi:hypothetical protein
MCNTPLQAVTHGVLCCSPQSQIFLFEVLS